ncbi:MAG: ATP-dependent RNA helicase RhlB [Candidatus Methanofastidiosum methylothiophilum]|uniref:ATP-dependent RNA helicase RhlB n=1 Tax=Candidatus Methanofastidiosum methylothiophilum TaxID=1705564 RepID=A0A150J375_9EURY|nr:MAG: ATP-dependent RNA helicase RhlB [Candidatus Methanofastidiosum methylthiophilus]
MENELNFLQISGQIKPTYYNSEDDTINEFLIPVLKRTKEYKRETYSFSSAFFSLINEALIDIIKNECKIYYIVGIEIEPGDIQAIENGIEDNGAIEEQIINEFGKVENLIENLSNRRDKEKYFHRIKMLSYLVSKEILTIKVGFVARYDRIVDPEKHKFHNKVMIFSDNNGNKIVANGSINESLGALINNEESLDVFKSWEPSNLPYLKNHLEMFDKYWSNRSKSIKTIKINKLLENKVLLKYKSYRSKEEILEMEEKLNHIIETEKDSLPPLRPFQEKVVKNWILHNHRGIFSLATGTGKTRAAIETIIRTFEKERKIVVIVCPFRILCEQWFDLIKKTTQYKPFLAYESQLNWYSPLSNKLISFKSKNLNNIIVITTNYTFSGVLFQKEIGKYWKDVFLIVDECHHVARSRYKRLLNSEIDYRLGLSATPENEGDDLGNKVLYDFFTQIIPDEYNLKNAISDGFLNEYNYYPILTELDDDEKESFEELLSQILDAKRNNDNQLLFKLYEKRDSQLDAAKTKLPNLLKLVSSLEDLSHTIIYCSDNDQLKKVSKILKDKGIKFGKITAEESFEERQNTIEDFTNGYIKTILCIRVLDEGIDIPAIKTAIILKSSTRTRQSIQRRGRCLRILRDSYGNKIEKNVSIYDFLVIPNYDFKEDLRGQNQELIELESRRINEFIELAKNKNYAKKIIEDRINILM